MKLSMKRSVTAYFLEQPIEILKEEHNIMNFDEKDF